MTDAAENAEGELLPAEIAIAEEESQEPEQGETSEATAEEETEAEADEPSSEETAENLEQEKQQKRNSLQKRISQLANQRNEANAKVAELEQQVAYLQSQYQQPQDVPQSYPELPDYDYDTNRHQQAVMQYMSHQNAQNVQQVMAQQQQAQIAQLEAQRQQLVNQEFVAKGNDFAIDYPDFHEKVSAPDFHQSDFVANKLVSLPNGPEVAYYLASNRRIADKINRQSDKDANDALITISTALQINSRRKSANTTNAPAPSKLVKPKGKVAKDPDKMTPDEYARYRGYTK